MPSPRLLDPSGRPLPAPKSFVVRTTKAPAVGHLLHSLGLGVAKQQAADGSIFLTAECDGLLLKIIPSTETSDPRETTLHFAVDSIDTALRTAAEREAPVVKPAHESSWGRRAIIADPDGRRIMLTEQGKLTKPEPSPPEWNGISIALPNDQQSETRFVNPSPKSTKTSEQSVTPHDLLPAIRAAKRAVVVMLVGGVALGIIGAAMAAQAVERGDMHRLKAVSTGFSFWGNLFNLIVALLFLFPRCPRLRYGAIRTVFAISVLSAVIFALYDLDIGDRDTTLALSRLAGIIGLTSPLLVYLYLAQLSRKAALLPLGQIVTINIKLYSATIGLVIAMIGAIFIFPPLAMLLAIIFIVVSIALLVGFIMFVIRLLRARTVPLKNSDNLRVPKSLGGDQEPIRFNV